MAGSWLLLLQFALTFLAFSLISAWWIAPKLAAMPRHAGLVPLLLVHAFRYGPLALLAPGPAGPVFSVVAYGSLLSAILALIAAIALKARIMGGLAITALFSVVGIADLVLTFRAGLQAGIVEQAPGLNWLFVTSYVPVLCISHLLILRLLLRREAVPHGPQGA